MADVNVPICLRSSDGKLIAIDANCSDVELPACMNASGELYVYHADCDGQAPDPENDGWFKVCRAAGGGLQITIPDDCCGGFGDCEYCAVNPPCDQYRLQASAWSGTDDWDNPIEFSAIDTVITRTDVCEWRGTATPAPCCSGENILWADITDWHLNMTWFSYYADRAPHCANNCLQWIINTGWTQGTFDCHDVNTKNSITGDYDYCCVTPPDGTFTTTITLSPLC